MKRGNFPLPFCVEFSVGKVWKLVPLRFILSTAMNYEKLAQLDVKDPLSETTRKERKSLLGMGIVVIAIVKIGMIPTKIEALGIEFSTTEQRDLFHILLAVVIYYLSAFIIYALADFIAWRSALSEVFSEGWGAATSISYPSAKKEPDAMTEAEQRAAFLEGELKKMKDKAERQELMERLGMSDKQVEKMLKPVSLIRYSTLLSIVRGIFEFIVPLIVGGYALYLLLTHAPKI
jgi:hypothetical protein